MIDPVCLEKLKKQIDIFVRKQVRCKRKGDTEGQMFYLMQINNLMMIYNLFNKEH
jgi:hypothetical protein